MTTQNSAFIKATDLSFEGILREVKKSRLALQPIFEGFTNALEAISIKQKTSANYNGEITVKIYATKNLTSDTNFDKLSITDNGVGFNEDEFKRFNTYKLANKGFSNLGSGRLQYLHYFSKTHVESVFEKESTFCKRIFEVSKNKEFLNENAVVKELCCIDTTDSVTRTTITFSGLLSEKSTVYNDLDEKVLKEKLLERYILNFCTNREMLPKITIEFYIQGKLERQASITQADIPNTDNTKTIEVYYSQKNDDGVVEKTNKSKPFTITAFKIPEKDLLKNKLSLVSKNEVVALKTINFECVKEGESINGNRYLVLVSSPYIDESDTHSRGMLSIQHESAFEEDSLSGKEEILINDIQEEVNNAISQMYPEIAKTKQEYNENLEKLKEMFLLDETTAKGIKISMNDSESKILEKFYHAEVKKEASLDASIKHAIDELEKLDTTSAAYQQRLKITADELVKKIPQQNKNTLTHYVARRKLVLELFQKILNSETDKLRQEGKIDEDVLHNLIFQQHSNDTTNSDLWLINEEYIYFKGISERCLGQIAIDGTNVLKEHLSGEEQEYRLKQGGDANLKRTDILLFPAEAKCIIVELKSPNESVSEHLNQINRYASLIHNLSKDTFQFNTFYGYLIGANIDIDDIRDNDADFIEAPNLGYIFKPYKRIAGKFNRQDGSLYLEVIKYSTLLERAKQRNKIFIEKLKLNIDEASASVSGAQSNNPPAPPIPRTLAFDP